MRLVATYVSVCLLGLVGGLLLEGAGVAVGGWVAVVAGLALLAVLFPLPEREDLPAVVVGVAALVLGAVVLRSVGAPEWTIVVGALVVAIFVLGALDRAQPDATGRIRVPPGYRFGSRKRR
jgi:hypothetical protein